MKSLLYLHLFYSFLTCVVYCSEEIAEPSLTLLTLLQGNVDTDESLTRFVRRAIFNGFEQGSSLRIIEATKANLASRSPPEVVKLETIKSAIRKIGAEAQDGDILLYVEHDLTMVLSSPEEIINVFKTYFSKYRVLLSTDATPCLSSAISGINKNGTQRYANFAGFVGYVKDLARIFKSTTTTQHESVADLFSSVYGGEKERNQDGVGLDLESVLFHTIMEDSAKINLDLTLSKDGVFLFRISTHSEVT